MAKLKATTQIDGIFFQGFPIGTILAYDNNNWIDNSIEFGMSGWYACVLENAGHNCPDLVNSFILGGISSGTAGGANSILLLIENLPLHAHQNEHNHGLSVYITISTTLHTHNCPQTGELADNTARGSDTGGWFTYNPIVGIATTYTEQSHTHSVSNTMPYSGTGSDNAVIYNIYGSPQSQKYYENRPAFYSMLFIRRCY